MDVMDLNYGDWAVDKHGGQTWTQVPTSEIERLRRVARKAEAHIAAAQLERDYWRRRAADLDAEIERLRPGSRRPSLSFWLGADGEGRA